MSSGSSTTTRRVRRRRVLGVKVLGRLDEVGDLLQTARPDEVLVTIPDVAPDRLDAVVTACAEAGVPCRLVRRRTETTGRRSLGVPAE